METGNQEGHDPDKLSSCQGCRKRKLKCSKDQPACSHCQRLDAVCVYDLKKNKPGIKTGVIEGLNRRLEALESAFSERGETIRHGDRSRANNTSGGSEPENITAILLVLAQELQKLNSRASSASHPQSPVDKASHGPNASPASSISWARQTNGSDGYFENISSQSRKRRRVEGYSDRPLHLSVPFEECVETTVGLPPPDLLEAIIDAYFVNVQPWIPLFHETRFRERIHDTRKLTELVVVLHAVVVAAARYVKPTDSSLSPESAEVLIKKSRNAVLLNAMDGLSIENLQALVILAFSDIGNGQASKAWSIVGSLTRTVEYLQLSVEDDDQEKQPLLKPMLSSPPAQSWTEEEERRRVFWNIFILDRFCSITTGWNTSLTADDVRRRLPADGFLWHKEEPVLTPYFGIWDRSVAKIGNSIAFLPTHYPGQKQSHEVAPHTTSPTSASTPPKNHASGDMSHVGAFAYCVEATESLSQVTTYFLQQRIDWHDRHEVSNWLTRFKELDLRLVHWKMFLPQRWKDSNVSRQPALINMDPNLTLAHVTHNTSMILLHQQIAYPQPGWAQIVQLPSFCSAETCQIAAAETANITEKYLKYTEENSPVTSQFAYCVFVSARLLLVHWRRSNSKLLPEFWSLAQSLDEMARRWVGLGQVEQQHSECLAGRYAERLRHIHRKCLEDPNFQIDVLNDSTIIFAARKSPTRTTCSPRGSDNQLDSGLDHGGTISEAWNMQSSSFSTSQIGPLSDHGFITTSTGYDTANEGGQVGPPDSATISYATGEANPSDELSAISHILLDQRFMELDRVISFDDSLFAPRIESTTTGAAMMAERNLP